jgi:cytochrome P450
MMSPIASRHSFNLTDRAFLADPYPVFHQMRDLAPVYRHVGIASQRVFWFLTRYHDVQQALRDPHLGRQVERLPADLAAFHRRWEQDELAMVRRNVFNLDPPDHTRLRRLLAPAFGARTVASIKDSIHQVVDDLVSAMAAADEVDLIRAVALPLPIRIIAELLAFPVDDWAQLQKWSDGMLRSRDRNQFRRCGMEFIDYVNRKIDERRAAPGEDLLSQLIQAVELGDRLSQDELVSTVFQLLLAGDETTVNLIGNGMLELLRHPDQLGRLRAQPELLDSTVEEMMRYNGPVGHSRPLFALADVEYGGTLIPLGDIVVPVLQAANRDPAIFPQPDVFDIGRSPNRHLGFGYGTHFCLGAELARLQVRAVVDAVVRRFPDLALAVDPADLEWTPNLFVRGVRQLPVRTRH